MRVSSVALANEDTLRRVPPDEACEEGPRPEGHGASLRLPQQLPVRSTMLFPPQNHKRRLEALFEVRDFFVHARKRRLRLIVAISQVNKRFH